MGFLTVHAKDAAACPLPTLPLLHRFSASQGWGKGKITWGMTIVFFVSSRALFIGLGRGAWLLNYLQIFEGGCWVSGWTVAKSAGDTKLCPASRWRRLLPPSAGHLLRCECQGERHGKRWLPAAVGMAGHTDPPLPPARRSTAILNSTSYLKLVLK